MEKIDAMHFGFHKVGTYVFFACLIAMVSCSEGNTDEKYKVINEAVQTFDNAKNGIYVSTQRIRFNLEKKKEVTTADRASIWLAKVQPVSDKSNAICAYITILRNKLSAAKEKDAEQKLESVLFKERERLSLLNRLKTYRKDILSVDPRINEEFGKTILTDFTASKETERTICFMNDKMTYSEIVLMLAKWEVEARMAENKITAYCDNQVMESGDDNFTSYAVVVGQSTTVTMPGSKIKITAGVGAFSVQSQPKISVGSISVPIDESGSGSYLFTVPNRPGNYSIPVKISFIEPSTGRNEDVVKNVEYTIIAPCDTIH